MHADVNEWGGRLGGLPGYDPPAAGWQSVVAARAARESRHALRWPIALAAAAVATVALLAGALESARHALSDGDQGETASASVAAAARAENAQLELILARLPETRAMRGSTAFTVAELEDRLALLDDRLSRVALEPNAPERAELLWRQRVGVMHSLVQVRYADVVGNY